MPSMPASRRTVSVAAAPSGKVREFLKENGRILEQELDRLLPVPDPEGGGVASAMRYTTLAPGKRIRPVLTLAAADLYRVPRRESLAAAGAIEMIHACSLILDDLPCMDDAPLRRGLPANHRVYGEATAILAAFGLLNHAYGLLSGAAAEVAESVRTEVGRRLSLALGTQGMIGGQALDLQVSAASLNLDRLEKIHSRKTGSLFIASVEAGAILGRAPREERAALVAFAKNLGLAYQILDDVLDAAATPEEAGKPTGSDGGGNFVGLVGLKGAKRLARELADCAVEHLAPLGARASLLAGFAAEMTRRR